MSTYGTANQGSRLLRPDAPRVRLTGIEERLNTPGLAIPAPVSQGANTAAQILALIEQVGGTANAANSYVRQGQADERRRQAEIEENARKQKQIDDDAATVMRGKAVLDFTPIVAERETAILTGKEPVPTDIPAYAEQLVRQAAGGETSEAYIESATRYTIGQLAQTAQRKNIENIRATDEQIRASYAAAAFSEPGRAAEVAADLRAKFKGLPEGQQLAPIAEAADRASRTGDRKAYEALAAVLPDSFAIQKDIYKNQLAAAETNRVRLRVEAAEADIGNSRYAKDYAGALAKLDRYHDKGKGVLSDGDKANSIRKGIEDEQRAELGRAKTAVTEEQRRTIISNHIADTMSLIPSGSLSKATSLRQDIKDEEGNIVATVSMDEAKVRELALQSQLAANDGFVGGAYGLVPDGFNPSLSERNIATASYSGMIPDQWKRDLESGFASASAAVLSEPGAAIPQTLIDGAATFRRIKDTNLAAQINDRSRVFYETYNDLRAIPSYANDPTGGGERRALADALRVANGPGRKLTDQERRSLGEKIESASFDIQDPDGPGGAEGGKAEMRSEIYRYANLFLDMGYPGTVSNLVDKAKKIVEERSIIINDAVVIDPGGLSPIERRNISKIGEAVIDDYMERVGSSAGYNREEIRFYTSGIGGSALWELRDQLGHSIPTKPGVPTRFTTREMVELWNSPEQIAKRGNAKPKLQNSLQAIGSGIKSSTATSGLGLRP